MSTRFFQPSLVIVTLAVCLISPSTLLGQSPAAATSGIVVDETGAVLPGVTVTTINLDTGIARTVLSDDEGRYRVSNLSLGEYEVRTELEGFQTSVRRGITLTVGREAVVDFVLKVGQMTETVEVTAEAPLVETKRGSLSGLVDQRTIRELPLNGRSFDQLALLNPGVVNSRQSNNFILSGFGLFVSSSGARPEQNSYLIDGNDINNLTDQPGSVAGVLLGVDAIREFEILVNSYSAQYGRAAGAVISAATRSGTKNFHGSAFEFHRNENLDARDFFTRGSQPEFKRNQFGAALGGPIVKNKTFFFGTYEGLRERLGVTQTRTVPNSLARRGLLPNVQNPGALINVGVRPEVEPYFQLYPLPNGPDFGDGTGLFTFFESQPTDENFFQVRIDHQLSESDSFFGRYTFDDATKDAPFTLPKVTNFFLTRNQYLTLEEKHIFSPAMLNIIRFGFNRSNTIARSEVDPSVSRDLAYIPGRQIGSLRISGLPDAGSDRTLPRRNLLNLFEFTDNLAYSRGKHSVNVGLQFKRFQANVIQDVNPDGTYIFSSLQNFLVGRTSGFEGMFPDTNTIRGFRQTLIALYAEDSLQIFPNLTWDLGLRYEFVTKPSEVNGKAATLPDVLASTTVVGDILLRNPSLKNFAPRLGFAWDPFSDGKSSVRGGVGLFYSQILPAVYFISNSQTPPFFKQAIIPGAAFPTGAFQAFQSGAANADVGVGAIDPFAKTPYTMQWNFNIQRQVGTTAVFTLGYVGSRGVHLKTLKDNNTALPEVLPDGRKFFPEGVQRRNRNFSQMNISRTEANSFYHGVQIGFSKRYGQTRVGPLQFQLAYTLSKAIDDLTNDLTTKWANSPGSLQDPDDLKADRGLAGFDIRHNVVINYLYQLPNPRGDGVLKTIISGWQFNGITTLTSGIPFNVQLGFNRSRNLQSGFRLVDRPNLKPGFSNNPTEGFRTVEQWFDRNAFQLQPAGFFGDLGRDTVIGPGFANFDFSLVKNTPVSGISEDFKVQFRAEFFNLFNRPNFSTPQNNITGVVIFNNTSGIPLGNAGRIFRTVSTARQIQFGLKFIW